MQFNRYCYFMLQTGTITLVPQPSMRVLHADMVENLKTKQYQVVDPKPESLFNGVENGNYLNALMWIAYNCGWNTSILKCTILWIKLEMLVFQNSFDSSFF